MRFIMLLCSMLSFGMFSFASQLDSSQYRYVLVQNLDSKRTIRVRIWNDDNKNKVNAYYNVPQNTECLIPISKSLSNLNIRFISCTRVVTDKIDEKEFVQAFCLKP